MQSYKDIDASIDALIATVGLDLRVALPLGIGKPNAWVNALYRRAKQNPALKLKIFTALSLNKPAGKSSLEKRFLSPFVERVFGDYPNLDYSLDAQAGKLPPNVEVHEFFFKTAEYVHNAPMQRAFVYTNYTFVVRDMLANGINVLAQAVAQQDTASGPRYSLSCNPDLTLDAMDMFNGGGQGTQKRRLFVVGCVNHALPFMPNDADIGPERFDMIVDTPACSHHLFAPPNMKVDDQDYAIAFWTSSLVKDGGTVQVGIGSLGDGIAHALILRDRDNRTYRDLLAALPGQASAAPETAPFRTGLFACSEMFVGGLLELLEAGLIRREVFDDVHLQSLLHRGLIGTVPDEAMIAALFEDGVIDSPLTARNLQWLKYWGVFHPAVGLDAGGLVIERMDAQGQEHTLRIPALPADPQARSDMARHALGRHLRHGHVLQAGFFLGPEHFYERLRAMPKPVLDKINMSRISYINGMQGTGHYSHALAGLQRKDARFINTCMMVTLLGAAVSDALEDGQFISGVGGQYNFVAQGHALADARSILMLRSWRTDKGKSVSNIVWNYPHTTIPRHLRDIFVTEYGVADLRGASDEECVKRLLAITDSRFQGELMARAKAAGKLDASYQIPEAQRQNLPEVLKTRLAPFHSEGLLPDFPFGTDFTEAELTAARALQKLKAQLSEPAQLARAFVRGMGASEVEREPRLRAAVERMGLMRGDLPLADRVARTLFVGNLG
jgi:acyl-CoA hydrolase